SKEQGFGYELTGINRYRIRHPRLGEKELEVQITPPQSISVFLDGEEIQSEGWFSSQYEIPDDRGKSMKLTIEPTQSGFPTVIGDDEVTDHNV
ncbi:MAG: hypothetical protein ABEJ65_09640, partial [bacterium]